MMSLKLRYHESKSQLVEISAGQIWLKPVMEALQRSHKIRRSQINLPRQHLLISPRPFAFCRGETRREQRNVKWVGCGGGSLST